MARAPDQQPGPIPQVDRSHWVRPFALPLGTTAAPGLSGARRLAYDRQAMKPAPLDDLHALLPPAITRIAGRQTPIPTIAGRAKAAKAACPTLVRGDIGQVVGVDAAREVLYGPPIGLPELRAAVAKLYNLSFGLEAPLGAEHVALCTGAAEGLSLLFRCFAHRGKVGLPRGHWQNYHNGIDLGGGQPQVVDFFDQGGRLDAEQLERQIRESGIALLVVNFPCNPTGAALDAGEMRALAAVVERTGVVAIADEVYARLRYDGVPPQTLLAYAPGHAVSVGSASKEYLLPGARVGYVVSARPALISPVLQRLVRANTASPNVLGQRALLARLDGDLGDLGAGRAPRALTAVRDEMARRQRALLAVLARHGMAPAGRPPVGTIFLMAPLPAWWTGDDDAFAEAALDGGWLSCIPGSAFGLPGTVRLSYGAMSGEDIARLDDNLTAMRAARAARAGG